MIRKIREWFWAARHARILLADNIRLGKLVGEKYEDTPLCLTGVEVLGDGVLLGFKGAPVEAFAQSFVNMFDEGGAINYVESQLTEPRGKRRQFTVTMQLSTGKTPHQLRVEAEAARDRLQKEFDAAMLLVKQNGDMVSSLLKREQFIRLYLSGMVSDAEKYGAEQVSDFAKGWAKGINDILTEKTP